MRCNNIYGNFHRLKLDRHYHNCFSVKIRKPRENSVENTYFFLYMHSLLLIEHVSLYIRVRDR